MNIEIKFSLKKVSGVNTGCTYCNWDNDSSDVDCSGVNGVSTKLLTVGSST